MCKSKYRSSTVCVLSLSVALFLRGVDGDWAVVSTTCAISIWFANPCTPYLQQQQRMLSYAIVGAIQVKSCKYKCLFFQAAHSMRIA